MIRDEIISTLRQHNDELKRLKIKSLSLFGSVARSESSVVSDIDLLVEFSEPVGIFHFLDVKEYLEEILGRSVDLVTEKALKHQLRERILSEAVHAF